MLQLFGSDESASARWLTVGLHSLFLLLVVIAGFQADSGVALVAGLAIATWYLAGVALLGEKGPTVVAVWLAALTVGWALASLKVTSLFVWLAFALFLLHLFLLPTPISMLAVVVVTAVAIVALDGDGTLEVAEVVGPIIGAGVAVVSTMAYRALASEHQRTRQLLAELVETRGRLAAAEREKGALEERRRLAREVHDTIAQGLSSIVLLANAATLSPSDDPAGMSQIGEIAKHNLDEARRIVSALSPPDLVGSSLSVALERAARAAGEPTGIDVGFSVAGQPYPLTLVQEMALLRVTQGALANAAAHSKANHVQVTLTFLDDRTTVDVVDDGIGFDLTSVTTHPDGSGFGIQVMRDRLDEVDGNLTVETAPDEGTAISASIPWQET